MTKLIQWTILTFIFEVVVSKAFATIDHWSSSPPWNICFWFHDSDQGPSSSFFFLLYLFKDTLFPLFSNEGIFFRDQCWASSTVTWHTFASLFYKFSGFQSSYICWWNPKSISTPVCILCFSYVCTYIQHYISKYMCEHTYIYPKGTYLNISISKIDCSLS